jgi:hypothetical protein
MNILRFVIQKTPITDYFFVEKAKKAKKALKGRSKVA